MLTLLEALQQGNAARLQELIKAGINLNQNCSNGRLPIQVILDTVIASQRHNQTNPVKIHKGHIEALRLLLESGISIQQLSDDEQACVLQNLINATSTKLASWPLAFEPQTSEEDKILLQNCLDILLEHQINIEATDKQRNSPLIMALQARNKILVKKLLLLGANPAKVANESLRCFDNEEMLDIAEPFIEAANLNKVYPNNSKLLDMVQYLPYALLLLRKGAQGNFQDSLHWFEQAQREKYQPLLDYLFENNIATYINSNQQTALHQVQTVEMAEKLLQMGADINLGQPLLWHMSRPFPQFNESNEETSAIKVCRYLVAKGARADCVDGEGNGLLYPLVLWRANKDFILEVINWGAPVNIQNMKGETVLHRAILNKDAGLCRFLIERGADVNLSDAQGNSPLECIKYLYFMGQPIQEAQVFADLSMSLLAQFSSNQLPKNHSDLILLAVHAGCYALIENLLQRGADIKAGDARILSVAVVNKQYQMLDWLLGHTPIKEYPLDTQTLALFSAISIADIDSFLKLLKAGINLNQPNRSGDLPLHECIDAFFSSMTAQDKQKERRDRLYTIFLALIENGADMNQLNQNRQSLLEYALQRSHWPIISILIQKGAKLPEYFQYILPIIKHAIENDDEQLLKIILNQLSSHPKWTSYLRAAAELAIDANHLAYLKQLHQQYNLDLNQRNEGRCLLEHAMEIYIHEQPINYYNNRLYSVAQSAEEKERLRAFKKEKLDRIPVIRYLIDSGAKPHILTKFGSLLHIAASSGYVELAQLFLESNCFDINWSIQDRHSSNFLTPLQLAVKGNHVQIVATLIRLNANVNQVIENPYSRECLIPLLIAVTNKSVEITTLLIKHGANTNVVDKHHQSLLHIACKNGDIEIAKLLLESGVEVNASASAGVFWQLIDQTPLDYAITCKPIEQKEALVNLLLEHRAKVNANTLRLAIKNQLSVVLITKLLNALSFEDVLVSRALHYAVEINNLELVKLLVERYFSDKLSLRNNQGQTVLHLATYPNRKAIFDCLLEQKATSDVVDYENYSVAEYALFNNTLDTLLPDVRLPISGEAWQALKIKFLELPEIAHLQIEQREATLNRYCYKLIRLLGTTEKAYQFYDTHKPTSSMQPLHDVCLFNLPASAQWHQIKWAELALIHGLELTPYLAFADRVEAILGRAANDLTEIKNTVEALRFTRAAENQTLADLCYQHKITELVFNRIIDDYIPKQTDKLPNLSVDGSTFGESRYYLKKLAPNDMRGFVLGAYTHCCQSIGSAGEFCAIHGMTSGLGGFYVVFKRPEEKDCKRYNNILNLAKKANTADNFIQSLSDKHQRRKYSKEIEKHLCERNLTSRNDALTYIKAKLESLLEGEIIAQSWAWLSQKGQLVFDSWERLRADDDRLCQPFLDGAAKQAAQQFNIQRVLIGRNGQTPTNVNWKQVEQSELPEDYIGYRDSSVQLLILARESEQLGLAGSTAITAQVSPRLAEALAHFSLFQTAHSNVVKLYTPDEMHELIAHYTKSNKNIDYCQSILEENFRDYQQHHKGQIEQWRQQKDALSQSQWLIIPILTKAGVWVTLLGEKYSLKEGVTSPTNLAWWYVDFRGETSYQLVQLLGKYKLGTVYKNTLRIITDNKLSGALLINLIKQLSENNNLIMSKPQNIEKLYDKHQVVLLNKCHSEQNSGINL